MLNVLDFIVCLFFNYMSILLLVSYNTYSKAMGQHYEQQTFILLQFHNNTHNSLECHLGVNWSLWTEANINRIFLVRSCLFKVEWKPGKAH